MQPFPYVSTPYEPTIKQVWLAAFTALLSHMSPDEAAKAAERALEISHERWSNPRPVEAWRWSHNYPIGYQFEHVKIEPPLDRNNP